MDSSRSSSLSFLFLVSSSYHLETFYVVSLALAKAGSELGWNLRIKSREIGVAVDVKPNQYASPPFCRLRGSSRPSTLSILFGRTKIVGDVLANSRVDKVHKLNIEHNEMCACRVRIWFWFVHSRHEIEDCYPSLCVCAFAIYFDRLGEWKLLESKSEMFRAHMRWCAGTLHVAATKYITHTPATTHTHTYTHTYTLKFQRIIYVFAWTLWAAENAWRTTMFYVLICMQRVYSLFGCDRNGRTRTNRQHHHSIVNTTNNNENKFVKSPNRIVWETPPASKRFSTNETHSKSNHFHSPGKFAVVWCDDSMCACAFSFCLFRIYMRLLFLYFLWFIHLSASRCRLPAHDGLCIPTYLAPWGVPYRSRSSAATIVQHHLFVVFSVQIINICGISHFSQLLCFLCRCSEHLRHV